MADTPRSGSQASTVRDTVAYSSRVAAASLR
jgi:hypothetical protein